MSGALRFGIGARPAIAAALAAHLLHLLAASPAPDGGQRSAVQRPVQGSTVTVEQVPLNSSEHRSTRSTDGREALYRACAEPRIRVWGRAWARARRCGGHPVHRTQ